MLPRSQRLPQREWHVLLYGANSTWQQDPRFQLCKSGVVFSDATLTSQIFRFAGCIVDLAAGPEKIGGELIGVVAEFSLLYCVLK